MEDRLWSLAALDSVPGHEVVIMPWESAGGQTVESCSSGQHMGMRW